MKAQELRIGNYVQIHTARYNFEFNGVKVAQIYAKTIAAIDDVTLSAQPIPLTEEWLRKFGFEDGFEKNELSAPYTQEPDEQIYIGWNPQKQTWVFLIHTDEGRKCITKSFQYIHQLQNIWFALTGEELTLKP